LCLGGEEREAEGQSVRMVVDLSPFAAVHPSSSSGRNEKKRMRIARIIERKKI